MFQPLQALNVGFFASSCFERAVMFDSVTAFALLIALHTAGSRHQASDP